MRKIGLRSKIYRQYLDKAKKLFTNTKSIKVSLDTFDKYNIWATSEIISELTGVDMYLDYGIDEYKLKPTQFLAFALLHKDGYYTILG